MFALAAGLAVPVIGIGLLIALDAPFVAVLVVAPVAISAGIAIGRPGETR